MEDILTRFTQDLVGRLHGPLTFRLLMQPLVALIYASIDGWKDARSGRPPYFWALFTDEAHRREMLVSGWTSIGKVFVLALLLDAIYQFIALRFFYPVEAVVVAVLLALVPYLIWRGPANRLLRGRAATRVSEGA